MPNIWTHMIFGQEVIKQAGLSSWIDNQSHSKWFNMGCQGPDFLFYHHFLPWKQDKTMNKVGSAMHNQQCGPVLMDLLTRSNPTNRADAVYVLGFLLHHILDRHMHPYVFVRSGFKKWDHQRFEVLMDTHVAKRKLGVETWRTPVWKWIDVGPSFSANMLDSFEAVVAAHYPEFAGKIRREAWNESIRDMVQAQKLFHDPYGLKRIVTFNQIEPMMYKKKVAPYDVMNEARRPWPDPTGLEQLTSTSVWDMWEAAAVDAERAIKAVLTYWRARELASVDGKATVETQPTHWNEVSWMHNAQMPNVDAAKQALQLAVGNHSYETGLPLEHNRPIVIEDPIWSS
ncbi:zinc dependent phospholipase C family protein [Paenibacillus agilis]|uniref:Zinc dependent phospholipase C family protein n=1 Tax=Paenibacillus agilis TaxID=3020863 RepID=A0A559IHK1_9BACL|nr:zinc dependent phospholipase C family protein [Paenibacillus agilis]TVX87152.1 zinc dependent phospholipase C family protein [Paenibacillus agilis]